MGALYLVERYERTRRRWEPVAIAPEVEAREEARRIRVTDRNEARVRRATGGVMQRPVWLRPHRRK